MKLNIECKKCKKEYNKRNKTLINTTQREYRKRRIETDELFKLKDNIRGCILSGFKNKNIKKSKKIEDILGCSWEEFKDYIESQFTNWMTWENRGNACEVLEPNCSWDFDHIIPISYAKTEEDIYLLNHWSNFQPLCSYTNRNIKKNNLPTVTNLELKITTNNINI